MKTRTPHSLIALFSGLVVVIAVATGWRAVKARQRGEAHLAELTEKNRRLASDLSRAERQLVAMENGRGVRSGAETASKVAMPKAKAEPFTSPATQLRMIEADPKLQVLELRRQRAAVAQDYGEFFTDERLTPAQIEHFRDNWVKWMEQVMDLSAASRTQDAAGAETVARLKATAKADYEAAQAGVLGADGYRRFQEFDRTLQMRNVLVRGFAGTAAMESLPLSAQQGDRLLQAAVELGGNFTREQVPDALRRVDWAAFETRARAILSPAQFTLFTSVSSPAGFGSRWRYQLDAAVARAVAVDPSIKALSRPLRRE